MSLAQNRSGSEIFTSIQAMRAVAALMIVLGHALAFSSITLPAWLGGGLIHTFAYAGVDIFFVISGIVVCAAASKSIAASSSPPQAIMPRPFMVFVTKRLFRIYPIYWLVFAVVCFFSTRLHLPLENLTSVNYLSAFFLIEKYNRIVPQAWSLVFELYFYLVLALIILFFNRHFYRSILIWLVLSLVIYSALFFHGVSDYVVVDPLILEFCLGCLIHYLLSKGVQIFPRCCLLLGLCAFVLGALLTLKFGLLNSSLRVVSFGIGSAFILYGLICMELQQKIKPPAFSIYLGDISYSIYLWHELVIGLLLSFTVANGNLHLSYPMSFLFLTVFLVIVLSMLSYRWIERPLVAVGNRVAKGLT